MSRVLVEPQEHHAEHGREHDHVLDAHGGVSALERARPEISPSLFRSSRLREVFEALLGSDDGTAQLPEHLSPELKRTSSPTTPSAASIATIPSSSNLQSAGPGTLAEALAASVIRRAPAVFIG